MISKRSMLLHAANIQISEHNTKQKAIFFVFIVEREYSSKTQICAYGVNPNVPFSKKHH